MQDTGLKDDDGNTIHELDIVYAYKKGSIEGYYLVVWDGDKGKWAYCHNNHREPYLVGKRGNSHCVIQGNPFDNPELRELVDPNNKYIPK